MKPVISVVCYVVTEDCYTVAHFTNNVLVCENEVIQTELSKSLLCQAL